MKTRSNISKQSAELNIMHPIVRCAAVRMAYFTRENFSAFYRFMDFYVSDANADFTKLVSQNIFVEVKNYGSYYYYSQRKFCVNRELVIDILSKISLAEMNTYLRAYDSSDVSTILGMNDRIGASTRNLAEALIRYLNDDSRYESVMLACEPIFKAAYSHPEAYVYGLISEWLLSGKYINLFTATSKIGFSYLREILIDSYQCMTEIDHGLVNHPLFFETNDKPYNDFYALIYVLQNELMPKGHIDDLIAKYSGTAYIEPFLQAIKKLKDGEFMPIREITMRMCDDEGLVVLEYPHIVLFFFGALVKDTSEACHKYCQKLLRSRDIKDRAILLLALLDWRVNGKVSQKRLTALDSSVFNPATRLVFTLYALHCHMFPSKTHEPYFMAHYINNMLNSSKMEYMRMLFAEEDSAFDGIANHLYEVTAMRSFLNTGEKKPRWQIALENLQLQLQRKSSQSSSSSSASTSRVAYLISTKYNVSIQPILQKSSNGVTWSKGRNIALKTFRIGAVEGMTEQDKAVALAVREEQSWSGTNYYLSASTALQALVGHPYIYTNDDERLKVEIVEEPLQLSVSRDKKGNFKFNFNISTNSLAKGVQIDLRNPTCIRIVNISAQQETLIEQLNSLQPLPPEAETQLAHTLSLLGTNMTVLSDLVKSDANAREVEASSLIVVQLVPDSDIIRVSLFAKPLVNSAPYLRPGHGSEYVSTHINGETIQARRDLNAETENLHAVEEVMRPYYNALTSDTSWELTLAEALELLNALNDIKDRAVVEWPEGVKMRVSRPEIKASDVHISVKSSNDWFSVEGNVKIDEKTSLKIADLLKQLQSPGQRFIRLNENEYIALSDHLAKLLRQMSQMSNESSRGGIRTSHFNALTIDQLEQAGVEIKGDKVYRQMIKRIETADSAVIKVPRGLQADLREYQKEGYRWMARLRLWNAGACLADDMGLGKTLQAIALLHAQRAKGASIVVAPASVLVNWKYEINRFAPSLNVVILNHLPDAQRIEAIESATDSDVVVTSYGLLVTRQEQIAAREWNIAVLDEAHTIKNRGTKMSKAAMTIKAGMRVALTGTPLQNRLAEIWNIFQFTNPGLLGSFQSFSDNFIVPIERDGNKDRQMTLKKMISPFILRRTKNDVLSELPEKSEITVRVELNNEERALYEQLRKQAEIMLAEGSESPMQALAELTRLRQAACNVRLIDPRLDIPSSKLETFMQLVDNLIENNHRALVFSQFTSHLALVRKELDAKGISYMYLDGSTPITERARSVDEFQKGDSPLFLISLKAGGLGLNLTAADYVIHLDPWWNPAIEDQASDRSYRIGQQKPVTVYRIIAADTIEEKILRLHQHKKSLADALLEGSDLSARLTKEDILALLAENNKL